jgi:hypothetical protein
MMGKSLGWFNKNQIYEMKNQIGAVVYSIAFLEEKPDADVYPFDVEDTIYFGMSGGMKNDYSFDRKNKLTGRGKMYSKFAGRIKKHFMYLEKSKDCPERRYELFHETYLPRLNSGRQLYVNLFVPDESKVEDFLCRSYISAIESEFILQYGYNFGKLPLMNIDENYEKNKVCIHSVSGKIRHFANNNNLSEFL